VDLTEALRTTGAVRDFERTPVPRDVVYDLLETARFAPSGGNRQCWRVVVVEDPATRRAVRDVYLIGWHEYLAQAHAGLVPFAPAGDRAAANEAIAGAGALAAASPPGPGGFAEHLDEVPVLLVVLADLRYVAATDLDAERYTLVGGASVYPFCWSILLAAHDVGLAGVLTTMATRGEAALREVLGLEAHLAIASVIALGYPTARATRLRRGPVERFTTIDRADGAPLSRGGVEDSR